MTGVQSSGACSWGSRQTPDVRSPTRGVGVGYRYLYPSPVNDGEPWALVMDTTSTVTSRAPCSRRWPCTGALSAERTRGTRTRTFALVRPFHYSARSGVAVRGRKVRSLKRSLPYKRTSCVDRTRGPAGRWTMPVSRVTDFTLPTPRASPRVKS